MDTCGGLSRYPIGETGYVIVSRPDVAPTHDRAEVAWLTSRGWHMAGWYRWVRDPHTGALLEVQRVDSDPDPDDWSCERRWIAPHELSDINQHQSRG
jgi:hypothetical protein